MLFHSHFAIVIFYVYKYGNQRCQNTQISVPPEIKPATDKIVIQKNEDAPRPGDRMFPGYKMGETHKVVDPSRVYQFCRKNEPPITLKQGLEICRESSWALEASLMSRALRKEEACINGVL